MIKYSLLALAAVTSTAHAAPEPSVKGLWAGVLEADDGEPVPLSVSLNEDGAATDSGAVVQNQNEITIEFPSGAYFKGKMTERAQPIHGFYIQSGNQIGGQALAHPVALAAHSDGEWRGTATPLARQFTVFMDVSGAEGGALTAVLLNPERNLTGPVRRYDFNKAADAGAYALALPGGGEDFASVRIEKADGLMRMDLGPLKGFVLSPTDVDSDVAVGFVGDKRSNELLSPMPANDWLTGAPEDAGFKRGALARVVQDLASASGRDENPSLVHSLLVARGGKLIVEEYFRDHSKGEPHDMRSAGKTFASVLVGALIQEGHQLTSDTPINKFISVPNEPDHAPVTIGDLLTHQSGLDCYDGDRDTAGHEDVMWNQEDNPNFWQYIAQLDSVAEPGSRYAYCSGGMNLVGAVLAGASGESVLSLLQTRLFEPLGFENAYWNVMPNGEAYLGGGAQLRTRDLLKIGQLYLDGGKWRGKQLIDRDWVKESTSAKVEITPATTGLDENAFNRFYFGGTDGLAWHLHTITVGDKTYQTYEASGNGGQLVVVIPDFDLVVGMTGGNYGQGYIWGKWRQQIIADGVIAALESE